MKAIYATRPAMLEGLEQRMLLSGTLLTSIGNDFTPGGDSAEAGTRVLLRQTWPGTWTDAEKDATSTEDDMLCWAATASNMLQWTGWGYVDGMVNSDQMLDYFEQHWTDEGGLPEYAIEFWFQGTNGKQGDPIWSQIDVNGGNFYPDRTYTDYFVADYDSANVMDNIDDWVNAGWAVGISLRGGGLAHEVTCWGYNFDAADPDYYVGIWISDSDDNKGVADGHTAPNTIHYYAVDWDAGNSRWSIGDYHADSFIAYSTGLQPYDNGTVSLNGDQDSVDQADEFVVGLDDTGVYLQVTLNGNSVFSKQRDLVSEMNIYGWGGDDTLTVDYTNGDPLAGVTLFYDGGVGGNDELAVVGAGLDGSYTPGMISGDGVVTVGTSTITFTGLEPVLVDNVGHFTFTTADGDDVITVSSPNAGETLIAGTTAGVAFESVTLTNVDHLTILTGIGNDSVTVDSTARLVELPMTYDGGLGYDTLTTSGGSATTSTTYTVGPDAGSGQLVHVSGGSTQTITSAGLEPVIDLVASPTLTVNATNAANAISYTQGSVAANGLVAVDGFETIEFSNKTTLVLNGLGGSDQVSLNNAATPTGLTSITVNGQDPTADTDVLVVNGAAAATIDVNTSTRVITGAGPVNIAYNTIEELLINAAPATTSLDITGDSFYSYSPSADLNAGTILAGSFPISFFGLGNGDTIGLAGVTLSDVLVVNGTGTSDTFTVDATTGDVTLTGRATLAQTLIEALVINGLGGDDTFNVPLNHPFTVFDISGGDPAGSDTINFTGNGAGTLAVNLASQSVVESGFSAVSFNGVEVVNIVANAGMRINGSASPDNLTYTPTAADGGTVQNGVDFTVNFTGITGTFSIDGLADHDQLTVLATNSFNTITVTGTDVTVAGFLPVSYLSIENLVVRGLAGADTFNVTPAANSIFIDGGDPIGVLPGDILNVATGGDPAMYMQGPESDEGGIDVGINATVSFDHIETVSISGGGPALILGTNDDDEITVIARDDSTHAGADGVQDFTVSVNAGLDILFLDTPTLFIDAMAGDDDIVFRTPAPNDAEWDVDATVVGGTPAASDRLVLETPGTDTVNFAPSGFDTGVITIDETTNDSTINLVNSFTFAFGDPAEDPVYISSAGGVELVVYEGQAGDDSLTITSPAGSSEISLTPGATPDAGSVTHFGFASNAELLPIDYSGLGNAGTLTFADDGGGRGSGLDIHGTAADDQFNVTDTTGAVQIVKPGFAIAVSVVINTPGVTHLRLIGHDGDDIFNIAGTNPFTTGIALQGGDPSGSDSLVITGTTGDDTISLNLAARTVTGLGGTISMTGVEDLAINGGSAAAVDNFIVTQLGVASELNYVSLDGADDANLSVTGTVNDDVLVVTPTGDGEGEFYADGVEGPLFTYSGFGAGGGVLFSGGGRFNVLQVMGSEDVDVIDAPGSAVIRVINGGNAPGEIMIGSDIDRLDVFGLAGDDTIDMSGLNIPLLPTTLYGGDGADTIIGSPLVDTIDGGRGRDMVQGGLGNDIILVGPDSDDTTWNAGDGDDIIEGGDGPGTDRVIVNGSIFSDNIAVQSNGTRALVTGDANGTPFALDMAQVEQLDLNGGDGDDTFMINDLDGTELRKINISAGTGMDLIAIFEMDGTESRQFNLDLGSADSAADTVSLNGGTGPDDFYTAWMPGSSTIDTKVGLERVTIVNSYLADGDALGINGQDGNDTIIVSGPTTPGDPSTGVEGHIAITLNGGAGNDYLSADAVINGGSGNDVLVSGQGNDTIDGGPGIDRVVSMAYGDTSLPVAFTLSNTQLVRNVNNGQFVDTDTLTNIEEAELIGGTAGDLFSIGAFLGRVLLTGDQGSDTVDYSGFPLVNPPAMATGIIVDLDLLFSDQYVNSRGSILNLSDRMENMVGSVYNDIIYVDALAVTRNIDGNNPTIPDPSNIPPGDHLVVDGRNQFVTVNRMVGGVPQADGGTVTAFGYQPVTFDDIEKLDIVNNLGSSGMGGLNIDSYTTAVDYPVLGTRPRGVVTGNLDPANVDPLLNGNNWVDFATINNFNTGIVSVQLNRGNGTFAQPIGFDTGLRRLYDIALADVDGDGFVDIITSGKDRMNFTNVVVLRGDGTGNYVTQAPIRTAFRNRPFSVNVADIGGTALPEVVINDYRYVMVLSNNAGTLTQQAPLISGGRKIRAVKLVDVDNDLDRDVVVCNMRSNSASVFLNAGGVLSLAGTFNTGKAGRNPSDIAVGDFDHDGFWDLAFANVKGRMISVLAGNGDGTFNLLNEANYSSQRGARWESLAAGDVNGDGKTDLVLGSRVRDEINILLSNGNGTFSAPYVFGVADVRLRQPSAIALDDFNSDGGMDIAVVAARDGVTSIMLKNLVV